MTKTLPVLTLTKTKELVLLNAPCSAHEMTSPLSEFEVRTYSGSTANIYLSQLIGKPDTLHLPYAIVADYKSLAANDFSIVRAIRKNLLTAAVPIVAIAEPNERVDLRKALQSGIDDCYNKPVDCYKLSERLDFLSQHKTYLKESFSEQNEPLQVTISPFKRGIDIVLASIIILILSPILIITALLIALESPGPIIYRSKRSGKGYQVFNFFKFRSMYVDADKRLTEIQDLNQYKGEGAQFVKFKNDPRITRVGKIIRKTSIDELPQLFNVLKGDMSLVGNRPLPLYEANQLTKEDWAYRFMAPAGMTGLWQVTKRGGNEMSAEERINLDVAYAQNHSFWFDLKLLLKTPFAVIQKENV